MKPIFKPLTEKESTAGTSYHDYNLIPCTPNELIQVLGEPDDRNFDKIQWEWDRTLTLNLIEQPITFCIYDYKTGPEITPNKVFKEWHIGSFGGGNPTTIKYHIDAAILRNRNQHKTQQ